MQAVVDKVAFPPDDPRYVTGLLALQLAAAIDHRPATVAIARESRGMLNDLTMFANEPPGVI